MRWKFARTLDIHIEEKNRRENWNIIRNGDKKKWNETVFPSRHYGFTIHTQWCAESDDLLNHTIFRFSLDWDSIIINRFIFLVCARCLSNSRICLAQVRACCVILQCKTDKFHLGILVWGIYFLSSALTKRRASGIVENILNVFHFFCFLFFITKIAYLRNEMIFVRILYTRCYVYSHIIRLIILFFFLIVTLDWWEANLICCILFYDHINWRRRQNPTVSEWWYTWRFVRYTGVLDTHSFYRTSRPFGRNRDDVQISLGNTEFSAIFFLWAHSHNLNMGLNWRNGWLDFAHIFNHTGFSKCLFLQPMRDDGEIICLLLTCSNRRLNAVSAKIVLGKCVEFGFRF